MKDFILLTITFMRKINDFIYIVGIVEMNIAYNGIFNESISMLLALLFR